MIKEIICVDIGKTIYVVSTDKDEKTNIIILVPSKEKLLKAALLNLQKLVTG